MSTIPTPDQLLGATARWTASVRVLESARDDRLFDGPREATPAGLSKDPSLVVYDAIGGGVGQTIGYIEGREAAQPFEQSPPIDAINAALIDEIFYNPMK